MFGGYTSKNSNDLWELDLSVVSYKGKGDLPGAVWNCLSQKGDVPKPRRGHKIVKVPGENKLICYGGYTLLNEESDKSHDNDIYVLDVQKTSWSVLKFEGNYPEPRALHCMAFFTLNKLIIMGGLSIEADNSDKDTPSVLDNTFLIDLNKQKVSNPFIANERPAARYGHVCAPNEDPEEPLILIIGGMSSTY